MNVIFVILVFVYVVMGEFIVCGNALITYVRYASSFRSSFLVLFFVLNFVCVSVVVN